MGACGPCGKMLDWYLNKPRVGIIGMMGIIVNA